jgi:hypothetical protein
MSKVEGCKKLKVKESQKLKVEGFNQPANLQPSIQPATFQPANLPTSPLSCLNR